MENNGQFLLYDAILALIILFVFMAGILIVLSTTDNTMPDSNEALDKLTLLCEVQIHSDSLLTALRADDDKARTIVLETLGDDSFTLKDLTEKRVLLEKNQGGTLTSSARKIVGGHEFELILYD